MNKILFLIFLILFIPNILALCEDGQIDINSASKGELDKLYGIGPVKAQAIIDTRAFDSMDDLIKVYGIGEVTLQKIKEQGLACVDKENVQEDKENIEEEDSSDAIEEQKETYVEPALVEPPLDERKAEEVKETKSEKPIEIIKLNAKNIKTEEGEENKEEPDKNNYAIYGFIVFCFLLGFLFYLRKDMFRKNEFN